MSAEATNWAMGHMRSGTMPSVTRFVLMVLANRSDPEGFSWPSVNYLVRHTGLSERTIRSALKEIAAKGLMTVTQQQRADGGKGANHYILRVDTPPPGAPRAPTQVHHVQGVGAPGAPDYKTGTLDKKYLMSGKPDVHKAAIGILEFLNAKTGRHYRPVKPNLDFITARLKEGATEEELRQVVAKKCREWAGDPAMTLYLRPATLFNRTKFAQYQGELTHAVS